jgi:hypothetical protein
MSKPKRIKAIIVGIVVLLLLSFGIGQIMPGTRHRPIRLRPHPTWNDTAEVAAAVGMPAGVGH